MQTALQLERSLRGAKTETEPAILLAISANSPAIRNRIETLARRAGAHVGAEAAKHQVLLLALDASSPLPASVEALSLLAPSEANVCVVWTSGSPGRSAILRFLRAGVAGIVSLEIEPSQFQHALRAIGAGLQVIYPAFTREEHSYQSQTMASPEELTEREQQVLAMMAEGLANKEISSRLAISTHTVKFHISSILGKLGVGSRTEAVSVGIRSGRLTI